jgi:hypothetical protein
MGIFSYEVRIMASPDISHHSRPAKGEFLLEDESALSALSEGAKHKLEDWLALELTAERMAEDELLLVRNYVASDMDEFVSDIKTGWCAWELGALGFLLEAADPTQVEWQKAHWWDGPADPLH